MTEHQKATTTQRIADRHEKERKDNAAQFAEALTRTLSQAVFRGSCKCGLMLTERDKGAKKGHYSCPRCGWTGEPRAAPSTPSGSPHA
jgi:hypothetical protein